AIPGNEADPEGFAPEPSETAAPHPGRRADDRRGPGRGGRGRRGDRDAWARAAGAHRAAVPDGEPDAEPDDLRPERPREPRPADLAPGRPDPRHGRAARPGGPDH